MIKIAKKRLLAPTGIGKPDLDKILATIYEHNIDYADLYFQSHFLESWQLEDSIVKSGAFSIDCGVGVRAIAGDKTGFAYADDLELATINKAATTARDIAKTGGENAPVAVNGKNSQAKHNLYTQDNPLQNLTQKQKVELLQRLDNKARSLDSRIVQVIISLIGTYETILVAAGDGTFAADIRPMVRLNISAVAEQNGRRESGFSGGGGRLLYDYLLVDDLADKFVEEAVQQALINLDARAVPAGTMPVVLGPGWPGVLLHEAVGHGLEGDFNRKGTSAFTGRIGEKVATAVCNVVDNGTLPNRRGSTNIDDEGTPTQNTILIENGILQGYLQDKHNARLMGVKSTGNGRRESYTSLPIPRMTNTYMLPGKYDPEEIIASVDQGLYAVNFSGGQVDITSGKFVFSMSEAYLIEKGKVTAPVKGATLIGDGPEVLKQVSMVGSDLKLDSGIGTCGKSGQGVPVGVGQPTLKIDMITVGGTQS